MKKSISKDIFSVQKRSEIMSKIRSKNTKLELDVFTDLRKRGVRFSTHHKGVLGNPDILILYKKRALFIDSDFWHGWRYPSWSFESTNDFWHKKILSNRRRDIFVTRKLRRLGWSVLRVWEHQIKKDRLGILNKMEKFLKK